MPTLPTDFIKGSSTAVASPLTPLGIPLTIGRFKAEIVLPEGGGSLGGFGLKSGLKEGQFMRLDYHNSKERGTHDWSNDGAEYFQGGNEMSHFSQKRQPWLHYHVADPKTINK